MTSQPFDRSGFATLGGSRGSAEVVAGIRVELLPAPGSIVDFGCGVGAWLAGFQAVTGAGDILGLEGGEPDAGQLQVPAGVVQTRDLQQPVNLGRRFDLAISVEVAEHLPDSAASTFVQSIARHTDCVVFSAAIPFQKGTDHINEQWPSYWYPLWAEAGFDCFDILRWRVWGDDRVRPWYRQNLLIYARAEPAAALSGAGHRSGPPVDVVHPSLFEHYVYLLHERRPQPVVEHLRGLAWSLRHRRTPPPRPTLTWPLPPD